MGHYPGSVDSPNRATIYGPLPDHGKTNVSLVLHTTETTGMPSFNGGDSAPHYVYDPTSRVWTMWAEYEDGYVGTLKGHSSACHGNCQAFQVEILAYSDSRYHPWVGEFTDGNYRDLADFYAWARQRYGIGNAVTVQPSEGWRYGTDSPYRMTCSEWDGFSGLTAHGAVPQNTHWDTGVLDLLRIYELSQEDDVTFTHFKIGDERPEWEPIVWFLFQIQGGEIDPNVNSSQVTSELPWKTSVRAVQQEDFNLISDLLNLNSDWEAQLNREGLYRWGREIAALQQQAWG